MTFINISNHPSNKWSFDQLSAACDIGGSVVDYSFPYVLPEWDSILVEDEANQFLKNVNFTHDDVFHIMGEMGFTFALVKELKRRGLRCVHSTTMRVTQDNVDGTKTSAFQFIRFRDYV